MSTLRRIASAFVCMLLAFAIFAVVLILPAEAQYGARFALTIVRTLPLYLFFTLAGWILALPFVILFRRATGWRTWLMLAIGTAIGPLFLLTWMWIAGGRPNWKGDYAVVVMPLFIGFLTTLFYVLLLRSCTPKAHATSLSRRDSNT